MLIMREYMRLILKKEPKKNGKKNMYCKFKKRQVEQVRDRNNALLQTMRTIKDETDQLHPVVLKK